MEGTEVRCDPVPLISGKVKYIFLGKYSVSNKKSAIGT